MFKKKFENDAVNLMRSQNVAVLSTLSKKYDDFPFGSFITYITGLDRSIYIYASDIAEHTKNILKNSKSCLTIFKIKENEDKQNSSRLSIMGDFKKIQKKEDIENCAKRFFKFLPDSKSYSDMHDFNFYIMKPNKIRWIGGFGEISWLKDKFWSSGIPDWSKNEDSIVSHVNNDHRDVIVATLNGIHNIHDKNAEVLNLCIDGYYLRSNNQILFIPFENPCENSKQVRDEFIKHSQKFKI